MRLPRLQFGLLGMLGLNALVAVPLGLARQLGRDSLLLVPSVVLATLARRLAEKPAQALAFSFLLGMGSRRLRYVRNHSPGRARLRSR